MYVATRYIYILYAYFFHLAIPCKKSFKASIYLFGRAFELELFTQIIGDVVGSKIFGLKPIPVQDRVQYTYIINVLLIEIKKGCHRNLLRREYLDYRNLIGEKAESCCQNKI